MARPQSDRVAVRREPRYRVTPWGVFWRAFDPELGKRRRYTEHYKTEAEARARCAEVEDELRAVAGWVKRLASAPQPLPVAGVTLEAHARWWLDKYVARKKAGSWLNYTSTMERHILPEFGAVTLSADTFDAQTVMAIASRARESGLDWSAERQVLRVLSACLMLAAPPYGKLLPANPVHGLVKMLRDQNWQEPEPNPLTFEQQAALLTWLQTGALPTGYTPRELRDDLPVDRPRRSRVPERITPGFWYPLFLLLIHTGIRIGEAVALRWDDSVYLDGPRPHLMIRRTYSPAARRLALRGKRQYPIDGMVKPKNGKERKVWLSPELTDVLRELARTRRERGKWGDPSPLVFVGQVSGRRLQGRVYEGVLAAGMIAIGAEEEEHTIHALRDTFATLHLERGTPLAWVSAMLGHAKRSITLDRYTKWVPSEAGEGYPAVLQRPDVAPAAAPAPLPAPAAGRPLRLVGGRRRAK